MPSCKRCEVGGVFSITCPECHCEALKEIERLRNVINAVHPRVWKLIRKDRMFIVIGEHEPYYLDAYQMIHDHEMAKGTWTEEDRIAFMAAHMGEE